MYCFKCGAEIDDNKMFCIFCGVKQPIFKENTGETVKQNETVKQKAIASEDTSETKDQRTGNANSKINISPEKHPVAKPFENNQHLTYPQKNDQAEQQISKQEKNNRHWIFLGAFVLLAVIIAVAVKTREYMMRPVEINLNKYITFTEYGYDGMGSASYTFDYDAFKKDYRGKIKMVKSKKDEVARLANEIGIEKSDSFAILFKGLINSYLSKTNGLSNGDQITLQWYCNEEKALEYFNVKLKFKDINYTLNDLKVAKEVDPFENITVRFEGYSGEGIAKIENGNDKEEMKKLVYLLDRESNLGNGMGVVVKVTDSEGKSPQEEWLEEYGINLTALEKKYVVSGLQNIREIDAFSKITVTFEGANGLGTPKAVLDSADEELQGLQFQFSQTERLVNDTKVTVTITDAEGNNPNKALEEKYGFKLKSLSQTYQVEGLKQYATKASEIPQETMEAMKKQAEDMINAHVARTYNNESLRSESLKTLVYTGNYFFNLKDGYDESTQDCILLVFKANVNMVRISADYDYYNYNFNENMDIYYAVSFSDLYMNDDGSVYIDLAKGELNGEGARKSFEHGTVKFSKAYNTMDFLKKDRVTPNLEKYTIEENFN